MSFTHPDRISGFSIQCYTGCMNIQDQKIPLNNWRSGVSLHYVFRLKILHEILLPDELAILRVQAD